MKDWWVDGYQIAAETADGARAIACYLFHFEPMEIRLWEEGDE